MFKRLSIISCVFSLFCLHSASGAYYGYGSSYGNSSNSNTVQFNEQSVETARQLQEAIRVLQQQAGGNLNQLLDKMREAAQKQSEAAQRQAQAASAGADRDVRMAEAQARAAHEADRIRAQAEADHQRALDQEHLRAQQALEDEARLKRIERENAEKLRVKREMLQQETDLEAQKRDRLHSQQIRHKVEEADALAASDLKNMKEKMKLIGPALSQVMQDLPAALEVQKAQAIEVEKLRQNAAVESTKLRWDGIKGVVNNVGTGVKDLMGDPKRLALTGAFVSGVAGAVYGWPVLWNYVEASLKRPKIVSETSWGRRGNVENVQIEDTILDQDTKNQLINIANRIKRAHESGENLFNVLFYGAPGTGKTMFGKAMAAHSGLDWAYMSGSEFTKITDTNVAISELQKLVRWAENSPRGMIIFIDEAESFLAERTLPTTTKWAQDMLNAFLAAVPKPTAKKMMFVFATNHPFKLDDAVITRIGERIEFKLPEQAERILILDMYLNKFAQANAVVRADNFDSAQIARQLEGIAPREIEYIAEKMVQEAKHAEAPLSNQIAQGVTDSMKKSIAESVKWHAARQVWIDQQIAVH